MLTGSAASGVRGGISATGAADEGPLAKG